MSTRMIDRDEVDKWKREFERLKLEIDALRTMGGALIKRRDALSRLISSGEEMLVAEAEMADVLKGGEPALPPAAAPPHAPPPVEAKPPELKPFVRAKDVKPGPLPHKGPALVTPPHVVAKIEALLRDGIPQTSIAKQCGVSDFTVSKYKGLMIKRDGPIVPKVAGKPAMIPPAVVRAALLPAPEAVVLIPPKNPTDEEKAIQAHIEAKGVTVVAPLLNVDTVMNEVRKTGDTVMPEDNEFRLFVLNGNSTLDRGGLLARANKFRHKAGKPLWDEGEITWSRPAPVPKDGAWNQHRR